jgi:hypothetical protein
MDVNSTKIIQDPHATSIGPDKRLPIKIEIITEKKIEITLDATILDDLSRIIRKR